MGVDEDYKVTECRQGEKRADALSDGTFRGGREKILRIIYAPLVVRLQGKYARIGYMLA